MEKVFETTTSEQGAPTIGEQRPSIRKRRNGRSSIWSDAILGRLREYYAAGLSHSVMALHINNEFGTEFSRNSMIGKCHREGFELRRTTKTVRPKAAHNRDRGQTQRIKRIADVVEYVEPELPSPDHLAVMFQDLAPHHCRFIRDKTFCGQVVKDDSSWCPFHHRLVYLRPTKPKLERLTGMRILVA